MNALLDAFLACNSLVNARRLVAHFHKNQWQLDQLTEVDAGQVRNAERMVESDRLARAANNMRFSRR